MTVFAGTDEDTDVRYCEYGRKEEKIMVISKSMETLVAGSSTIRKMFEEGLEMAERIGKENVYDFSLGNPSIPAPKKVKEAILDVVNNDDSLFVHGYMKNAGYDEVRAAIADSINERFDMNMNKENIVMTVGAAGGLNCVMRALLNPGDEVVCFAPFFSEYRSYANNFGGSVVMVPADTEHFQLKLDVVDSYINEKTKAMILNSPNNPSGSIYSAETLTKLQEILEKAEKRIGHPIYVISDEPYRELAYDGNEVPYMPKYIKNCIVGYSFSKSLSLPGERIGYLAIPEQIDYYAEMQSAIIVANRCLGFVNAPSLMQLVVKECLNEKADVAAYDRNRKTLYGALTEYGFDCVYPQGAFYLFMKSPVPDEKEFVNEGKKLGILMVPASSFGCPGYVRMAYCVSHDMIEKSLPAFKKLSEIYFGK